MGKKHPSPKYLESWTPERRKAVGDRIRKEHAEGKRTCIFKTDRSVTPLMNEEIKKHISEALKKGHAEGRLKSPTEGKPHSEETKEKIRQRALGRKASEETKLKLSLSHKGKNTWSKGRKSKPESIEKTRAKLTGMKRTPEQIAKLSIALKGVKKSPGTGKKFSELRKLEYANGRKVWNDGLTSETDERVKAIALNPIRLKKYAKSINMRPNKCELRVLHILDHHFPNQFKYTGDFSLILEGRCPDYIHLTQKKIIEFNGDYFHNKPERVESDKRKMELYERLGYKVLIIWEHELKDEAKVIKMIEDFLKL